MVIAPARSTRVVASSWAADDYVVKPFSPGVRGPRRAPAGAVRNVPASTARAAGRRDHHRSDAPSGRGRRRRRRADTQGVRSASGARGSAGRALSREHLLERVWGYSRGSEIESRTVDVHVRRLRAKLGDAGRSITTLKGVGYRLEDE